MNPRPSPEPELLINAAKLGKAEMVAFLLDQGADIHAGEDVALCWAAERGHTETVALLKAHAAQGGPGNADLLKRLDTLTKDFNELSDLVRARLGAAPVSAPPAPKPPQTP